MLDSHGDDSVQVIAEGAGVIAKNTMAGLFGGVNNTTGSIAGVFSLMSGDKEFMKERGLQRRKKAKNVLQGFEQGFSSLVKGITAGIGGVVILPYKEVTKPDGGGFLLGMAKGLSGLVTKPISGILDTISKTAEVPPIVTPGHSEHCKGQSRERVESKTSKSVLQPGHAGEAVFLRRRDLLPVLEANAGTN